MKKLFLFLLTVVSTMVFAHDVMPRWPNGTPEAVETQLVSSLESGIMVNTLHTITALAKPSAAGTVSGSGTYEYGSSCTLTATPAADYQFISWTQNGTTVSTSENYTFTVTEDGTYVANFCSAQSVDVTIGSGTSTSLYLPSYSYYKYSFTEQIYTAAEIGGPGVITAVSFKVSNSKSATRKVDLYLKPTSKTAFTSKTGWEALSMSDRVYSGTVTFNASGWTTITLTTPFIYDGTSNLVIGMDDNTGSYVSSSSNCPKFYVYPTGAKRALRIYGDNNNYNPAAPTSYNGSYITSNDQIVITMNPTGATVVNHTIIAAANPIEGGAVAGAGTFEEGSIVTLKAVANEGYYFVNWTRDGTVVSTDANYSFTVVSDGIYVANFEEIIVPTYDITVAIVSNGVITSDKRTAAAGETVTLTAIPNSGCYFSHWIVYQTGNISNAVSVNDNRFIMPEFDVTVAALFPDGSSNVNTFDVTIGSGDAINAYLPTYSYYRYSLTEQIYTASEIGQAGTITAIAFKVGNSKSTTRNVDIYIKTTDKYIFTSRTGWEPLSTGNKVYSGLVTFNASGWTVITLNTPFVYDGTSNLLIGVDDNTGSYVSGGSTNSPRFYVYPTGASRAMRVYGDNTNYNPASPTSYSGTTLTSSNQIQLTMMANEGGTPEEETLFVTPIVLSDFTYTYGNGPSEAQSFAVIGANLDNAVTVAAPINYEISETVDGTYGSTLTFTGIRNRNRGVMNWDFEDDGMSGWTALDVDGDEHNWMRSTVLMSGYDITPHSGEDMLSSESFFQDSYLPLNPDNWLVSPEVPLGGTFTMWACAQDADYLAEHFGILVSTTSNTDTASFTMLNEWTIELTRDESPWVSYSVDLSAYAGQTGYIAVRHFNCTDQYYLNVDDFSLTYDDVPVIPDPTPVHIDYLTANVFVRLKADLSEGRYNETLTVTSGDATATVTLNGEVTGRRNGIELRVADAVKHITLYPNPANRGGIIRFAIPEDVNMDGAKVEIYNELGVLVYNQRFAGEGINNDFAAGLYTVRIIDTNGNVHHCKLIVK